MILVKIRVLEVLADETVCYPPLPPHARFKMPLDTPIAAAATTPAGRQHSEATPAAATTTSTTATTTSTTTTTTTGKKYFLRDSFRSQTSEVHTVLSF